MRTKRDYGRTHMMSVCGPRAGPERRKRRVKAWMTRREDEEPRTERAPATTWLLLPSDVLTVARCRLASPAIFPSHMLAVPPPKSPIDMTTALRAVHLQTGRVRNPCAQLHL